MNGWGWFFLILFLILLVYGGWCGWRFFSAKRQGLPPPPMKSYIPFMKSEPNTNYPSPRASGPLEWIKEQFAKLQNKRTARGAYEEAGGAERGQAGRRGRGLEDDAWDTRVGNEDPYGHGSGGYYNEEQELGLAPTPGYANEPYGRGSDYISSNTGYAGGSGYAGAGDQGRKNHLADPFGDENQASSIRSVSPRPQIDTSKANKRDNGGDSGGSSPTSVRKSVFREGI